MTTMATSKEKVEQTLAPFGHSWLLACEQAWRLSEGQWSSMRCPDKQEAYQEALLLHETTDGVPLVRSVIVMTC